jgi:hypothetical protein
MQFVIRFAAQPLRTVCPVTEKAIFGNRESDQSVARFNSANFGLELRFNWMIVTRTRAFGIIVIFAQSEFNLVGSPLYGGRPQAPYRRGAHRRLSA